MPVETIVIDPEGKNLTKIGRFSIPKEARQVVTDVIMKNAGIPDDLVQETIQQLFLEAFGEEDGPRLYYEMIHRAGSTPFQLLGVGTYGYAFLLESGYTLKITSDWNETAAAKILVDNPDEPGVANFYDSFVVTSGGVGFGIIVREYVEQTINDFPADNPLKMLIQFVADPALTAAFDDAIDRGFDHRTARESALLAWIDELERSPLDDPWLDKLRKDTIAGAGSLLGLGIYITDLHVDNIGIKGNGALIFDIGGPMYYDARRVSLLSGIENLQPGGFLPEAVEVDVHP